MKAYKYKVKVSEGTIAFVHGVWRKIKEIYIPEKRIVLNIEQNTLNAFHHFEPRNKDYTEIEIDKLLAEELEQFIITRQKLEKKVVGIFEGEEADPKQGGIVKKGAYEPSKDAGPPPPLPSSH